MGRRAKEIYQVTSCVVPIFQTVLALGVSTGGTKTSRFCVGAAEMTEKKMKRAQRKVFRLKFMADLIKVSEAKTAIGLKRRRIGGGTRNRKCARNKERLPSFTVLLY